MRSEGSSRLRRISRRKLHMKVATVKLRDLLTYHSIPGSGARASEALSRRRLTAIGYLPRMANRGMLTSCFNRQRAIAIATEMG